MSENIPNFPDNAVQSKKFTIDSPLIQEQIKKNEKQGVTPEAIKKLVKELEEFYKLHPSSLNLFDLSNLISSRLASDRDLYAVVEGVRGCLTGDTMVQINRFKLSRRYSMKALFENQNGLGDKRWRRDADSYVRSFNGKEIKLHKIKEVTFTGIKEVYILRLQNGLSIKATADHKIMTDQGWVELKDLKQGDQVMCDRLHAEKSGRKRLKLRDIVLNVGKYHPNCNPHKGVAVHILIYEAHLNKMEFLQYLDILLNEPEICKTLKFVDSSKYEIHHKDGNHYNNSIDNLEMLKKEEHQKIHGDYSNFSQGVPKFSPVLDIKFSGKEEVYDIECEDPYHNFVANGIVVHNSGKSNLLLLLCLLMCRNAGYYRHRETGHIVKVLPKRQIPLNDKVWERLSVNFDFDCNLSFMDQVEALQKKFNSLDRYQPFGIDEGSKNLHKQNWQSKVQFKLVLMSDAERYQNKAFFICIPNFKELNSVFRNDRVFIRIYIYVRHTNENFSSAIISMKDPSRWNIDPWFLEENMRLFEHILKNKPTAMRTPNDIIKAERKLKGFVGELNIPSLKTLAPEIWETYLKYKIENAKKEAAEESDEANPDKEKIKELEFAINKLIRAARIKIHSLTGKQLTFQEISEITGLKSNAIREIVKDTSWLNEDESTAKVAINEKLKNVGL